MKLAKSILLSGLCVTSVFVDEIGTMGNPKLLLSLPDNTKRIDRSVKSTE